ncbi:o-succinylbenzoate synthase, partial [Bacteroidota bacterium]
MLKAEYVFHSFRFKNPATTSRGILRKMNNAFILLKQTSNEENIGIGECAVIPKLSIDDTPVYKNKLKEVCTGINEGKPAESMNLKGYPSILFGLEMALLDLKNDGNGILFPSPFTRGLKFVKINGLIWMGAVQSMLDQIKFKLKNHFTCLKIKVGSINFDDELRLLKIIRKEYSKNEVQIRLDANGAFAFEEAMEKINR